MPSATIHIAVPSTDGCALRGGAITAPKKSKEIANAWRAAGVVFDAPAQARRASLFGGFVGGLITSVSRPIIAALFSRRT